MKRAYSVVAILCAMLASAAMAADPQLDGSLATDASAAASQPDGAGASASVAVIPVQAAGKDAAKQSDTPPAQTERGAQRLDDVIVTATKREKSVREVPASISAVRGEDLEKIGARDIKDYLSLVPGITLEEGNYGDTGSRRLSVRGVGPPSFGGQTGNQTVGQFIGDVPMTDPYSNFVTPDLDPYDLKTVEVLKGPQGTTFGASALAGAIRYIVNPPELNRWNARGFAERVSVTDGGQGENYGAAANAPIGDSAAIRVTGMLQHQPGVYDSQKRHLEDTDSRRKWSGRAQLLWNPLDKLTVTGMYLKQQAHVNDVSYANNPDGQYVNTSSAGPSIVDTGFSLYGIDARYEFDDFGTLVYEGAGQKKFAVSDLTYPIGGLLPIDPLRAAGDYQTRGTTHELRLVSPDAGKWSWIVGAFMQDYRADASTELYVNAPVASNLQFLNNLLPFDVFTADGISASRTVTSPIAKELSFYGELGRKLFEDWELTVGLRHYRTSITGQRVQSGATSATGNTVGIDQRDQGLSPKVSLTWKPSPGIMAYGAVSRGFQFGGINLITVPQLPTNNPVTGTPVPVEYGSSTLWNYELGLRTEWLDKTLRADLTAFDMEWNNAQVPQSSGGLYIQTYYDNVGKVRSRGLESTVSWLTPIPGLALTLSAAYTQAVTVTPYKDDGGTTIPAGAEMPATPHIQTATTLSYNTYLGPYMGAASLIHTYSSRAYTTLHDDIDVFDYQLLNLNLSVTRPDWTGRPAVDFVVSNLLNEAGIMDRGGTAPLIPNFWNYTRPRTFSLRLSAEFE